MDQTFIYLVIIGMAAFGIVAFFFSDKARIKRKLKKAELKPLASYKDGDIAKVVGKVELVGTPLEAPLSGRKCGYYHVLVEQEKSSGKNSSWHTLIDEEVSGDFVIRDGANRALIRGRKVKSHIVQDRKYKSGFLNDATQNLERYLRSKGYESENMLGLNKTLRYKEGVLEPDEVMAVYGQGTWKSAQELELPDSFGRVLEITSPPEEHIYLSDDPDTTKASIKKTTEEKPEASYGSVDSRYFKKPDNDRFYKK